MKLTSLDLNRDTRIEEQYKSAYCSSRGSSNSPTGKSNRGGMVFNSTTMCMATALPKNSKQPGVALSCGETSGLPFFDILLTWQGILNYTFKLVLNTPLEAAYSTPVSSAFFTSKDYPLCSSGEQKYKTRKGNIAGRLLAVFKHSNNSHLNNGPLNKLGGSHHG